MAKLCQVLGLSSTSSAFAGVNRLTKRFFARPFLVHVRAGQPYQLINPPNKGELPTHSRTLKSIKHMLEYHLENLLQAFDHVQEDGTLEFVVPRDYLDPLEFKGRINRGRELIKDFFFGQCVALVRFDLVKSFAKDVILEVSQSTEGHWVVRMNFAKLMLMPGKEPAAELKELRKLFEEVKALMQLDPSRLASAKICNERSRTKKVYGSLQFHYRNEKTSEGPDCTAEAQSRMAGMIANSPIIREYLRQVALALGTMGPWSWAVITEAQLFGAGKGPWETQFRKNLAAQRKEAQAKA